MKKYINILLFSLICITASLFCCSCTQTKNILREPYPGFTWKDFSGAGLTLKVQENSSIKFTSDSDTIYIKKYVDNKQPILSPVIKVYTLKNNDINTLLSSLKPNNDFNINNSWYKLNNCEFIKIKQANSAIQKYILTPKGNAKIEMDNLSPKEPIPHTCGGYGVGNSGTRYFVTFNDLPEKAVFVEIGQDMPLFDENSIKPICKNSSHDTLETTLK